MSISVKSFDELPLTNEKFRTNISGKNKRAVISFETLADQKVHLIVGDEIVPVMVDKKGKATISNKYLVEHIHRFGFSLVDMSQIAK